VKRIEIEVVPVPPFRLDLTAWTLRRRAENIVDRWDGETYRRVVIGRDGKPFEIAARQEGPPSNATLRVSIACEKATERVKREAREAVERLLGTAIDLAPFYRMARRDKVLWPVAEQFRGFKPPRLLTRFEALVNAIGCQQLTLTMGIRLIGSLTVEYGLPWESEEGTVYAFPRPADLVNADPEVMRAMKYSYRKAEYIIGMARAIASGELKVDSIDAMDDAAAIARLCEWKGIGRWTAEYALLRGWGRTHIFPGDDVGARKNIELWLGLPSKLNYETTQALLAPWKDYGGLLYFHMLLRNLANKSVVTV